MITIKEALANASKELSTISDTASLDAELLLLHILQADRSHLHAWPDKELSNDQSQQYQTYLNRRLQGEPIAYITGIKEFWSLPLHVTPDTLIPRPETELLIELILERFQTQENLTLADLGTGSGAIAIALAHEKPKWQITATDKSQKALDVATQNTKSLALTNIQFVCGDWFAPLADKKFNVIVSNPPYISHEEWQDYKGGLKFEPATALLADNQGLADIEKIIRGATSYLQAKGLLIIEHGFQQGEQIRELFDSSGYKEVETVCDLASQDRVTLGYY